MRALLLALAAFIQEVFDGEEGVSLYTRAEHAGQERLRAQEFRPIDQALVLRIKGRAA